MYLQVRLTVMDENTANREFDNVLKIEDNYPKYVVSLNDVMIGDSNGGIIQQNLIDFFTNAVSSILHKA